MEMEDSFQVHRIPQSKYVDGVRWLPQASALTRSFAAAFYDPDCDSSSIEIQSLDPNSRNNNPSVDSLSSWTSPSRVSSLEVAGSGSFKPMVSVATSSCSLHVLMADLVEGAAIEEVYVAEGEKFHVGRVEGVDWREAGECVTVGGDGRVNVVTISNGEGLRYRRVFDGNGLVAYRAVKWASPTEFVTGGYGFGLQLWDQRKPGEAVSQLKGNWFQGKTSAIVHSIDIHPSRKHTCIAGRLFRYCFCLGSSMAKATHRSFWCWSK